MIYKGVIVILILCLALESCQRTGKAEIRNDNLNSTPKTQDNTPIYTLKVSVANPYEILINDMPFDKSFDNGSTSFELPINDYVLQSGPQRFKVTLFPDSGEFFLDKIGLEYLDIKVYKYSDISSVGSGGEEIGSIDMRGILDSPLAVCDTVFNLEVPYQLTGWSASVDLSEEDRSTLEKEVLQKYESLQTILNSGSLTDFLKENSKRDIEIDRVFYADSALEKEDLAFMKDRIKKSKNNMAAINYYILRFYGNGRVVALEMKNGKSALYGDDGNQLYYYMILLHRPKKGESLVIIR